MPLEREIATYDRLLPDLLGSSEGRFVVIVGEDVLGTFGGYDEAVSAGLRLGVPAFLCRQVSDTQPVHFVPTMFRLPSAR